MRTKPRTILDADSEAKRRERVAAFIEKAKQTKANRRKARKF